ncbi:hypothetical protein EB796_000233 [Bugula neritina]|uniref:Major facilitator superfamily (MFS) profile domain-containing protein n=1 Tax=Bugula neritina TaxID=10212 RepID=A0A7J7KTB5_BUGNE|nr:hypothetical protein EB796_000233 [Bugula neritina]
MYYTSAFGFWEALCSYLTLPKPYKSMKSCFPFSVILTSACSKKQEVNKQSSINLLNIPGVIVLFFQVTIYKTIVEATYSGASNYLSFTFQTSPSTLGIVYSVWSAGYLLVCPLVPLLVNKGFIYSPILIAWVIAAPLYMLAGPSPLLEFLFNGQKYFLLTVITITISIFLAGIQLIPSFQAAINLAAVNGHEKDSMQTYGAVTGTLNSAIALGSLIGPVFGGAITQVSDFTWTLTSLAGFSLPVVTVISVYLLSMKLLKLPLKPIVGEDVKIENGEKEKLLSESTDEE